MQGPPLLTKVFHLVRGLDNDGLNGAGVGTAAAAAAVVDAGTLVAMSPSVFVCCYDAPWPAQPGHKTEHTHLLQGLQRVAPSGLR